MNRNGQIIGTLIALAFLIGIIILFWAWSLFAPPILNTIDEATDILSSASTGDGNLSNAVNNTFVPINNSLKNVQWITYAVLICIFIGFFIVLYFIRDYPFLIVVWLAFIVLLGFVSIFMSNAYTEISSGNSELAQLYRSWSFSDFILSNLPAIVVIVGVVGGIILFMASTRDQEQEAVPI